MSCSEFNRERIVQGGTCADEEDPQVQLVSGSGWLERLGVPPLIKNSPAEPFLVHYYRYSSTQSRTEVTADLDVTFWNKILPK